MYLLLIVNIIGIICNQNYNKCYNCDISFTMCKEYLYYERKYRIINVPIFNS